MVENGWIFVALFKIKKDVGYENTEAFFKDHDVSFTDNEEGSDADDPDDKDWIQTPLYRRIKQVREQNKGLNNISIILTRWCLSLIALILLLLSCEWKVDVDIFVISDTLF